MASKREKFGLILLGIFLGLVVSASFLWWQQHLLKKDWFSFKGVQNVYNKLFGSDDDVLAQKQQQNKKTVYQYKLKGTGNPADTLDARLDSLLLTDSANLAYLLENGALEYYIESGSTEDTIESHPYSYWKKFAAKDTVRTDTAAVNPRKKTDEFVIKRDQYLLTRLYTVAGYPDSLQKASNRMDSLLMHDNKARKLPMNAIRVEFWKSPVNYTGYKLSVNRLVLFGSFNPDEIILEYHNHKLFLRYKNTWYQLENANDFQALVSVRKP